MDLKVFGVQPIEIFIIFEIHIDWVQTFLQKPWLLLVRMTFQDHNLDTKGSLSLLGW